ncbi:hypothetical protein [Pseudonocardia sp. GCM10023141]|uniref:hypothetical protein n=1 Tax=Pseudonocardia sp. GCM10023141 TaxID=3252653 RepID=UPI003622E7AC
MSDTAEPATDVMELVPPEPSPEPTRPLRSDVLGRWALVVAAVVTALSVVRALLPMPWLGDIWRPADTATIAHNFYVGGMDLLLPQINWGGAGPGYVDAELQLLPWISAALYHVVGEHA